MEIITEEQHFLTINKPAGLFSQAARGIESVQTRLAEFLKVRDDHPGNPFVGLPHRLDRATSGVMLIARNKRALAKFGDQFQSRKVAKTYCAVLAGELNAQATWTDYLVKVEGEPRAIVVDADHPGAKQARLTVTPIAIADGHTLASMELHTGRMHQIRVQSSTRGLAVAGDPTYGPKDAQANHQQEAMALHAFRIEFHHPKSAKRIAATAPVPETWQERWPSFEQQLRALCG